MWEQGKVSEAAPARSRRAARPSARNHNAAPRGMQADRRRARPFFLWPPALADTIVWSDPATNPREVP